MLDQWTSWEAGPGWLCWMWFWCLNASVLQMQELEQRVTEADQRADHAQKQVRSVSSACC